MRRGLAVVALTLAGGWAEDAAAEAAGCAAARSEAPRLVAEITPRATAEPPSAQDIKRGVTPAGKLDAAAAASFLRGEIPAAASASLQALLLGWTPRRAANAGVALIYLGQLDRAAEFLGCARSLDPNLVFAIEAQALLAHRRKDCPTAVHLIDGAVMRMPRDANARYSAGIIHYKCGDRAGAERQLRAAVDMAGVDPVMVQALAVVAPGAAPKTQTPKDVRKQIDELYRFMDEAVATAERDRDLLRKVARAGSHPDRDPDEVDRNIETLKSSVAQRKSNIERIEALSRKQAAQYPQFAAPAWNGLLDECVRSYFQTLLDLYRAREPGMGIGQMIVMAASFGQEPVGFAERMHGSKGWIIQHEAIPYEEVVKANTHIPRVGVNCPPIRAAYRVLVERTEANRDAFVDGFPRAAADYMNVWLAYAGEAADYANRTVKIARFGPGEKAAAQTWAAHIRSAYESTIRGAILQPVGRFLKGIQGYAVNNLRNYPSSIRGLRVTSCDMTAPQAATLTDAFERLLEAFDKAGSYDADFESPDCTLEIGSVKVSCKPLAFEGVKASMSGPVKVSANLGGERWGVDASAGSFSASGSGSGRMNVASTSTEASAYGIQGELGVSSWIEQGANGQANAYVQAKGTLGAGVDVEGVGKLGCEVFSATAKFNLRAFAETLTR